MTLSSFLTRVDGWYVRKTVNVFHRRPLAIKTSVPLVSFTFDDFPRSALFTGGEILRRYGALGTYYAAFGLMGKQAPTGQIFAPEDLKILLQQGHELGCHTFAHCDAWKSDPRVFEESIVENRSALERVIPGASFKTHSYPIAVPRGETKRRTGRHFLCCRGGGQIFNSGNADLNYLAAFFIEKSRDNPQVIKDLIEQNRQARGWLILATHDVCQAPSPFGCVPELFEEIVNSAVNSGALILPVAQALETLRAS